MAKLRAIPGKKEQEKSLSLVYGLRLYRSEDLAGIGEGHVTLKDGSESHLTLHLIEGTHEQIRAQLLASIDAFFDIASETSVVRRSTPLFRVRKAGEADDPGC